MHWLPIRDGDPRGFGLYMRHYSARKSRAGKPHIRFQKSGRRWMGNGEHIGLLTQDGTATFAWRKQVYRKDGQTGVECSIFRNEGPLLSSCLIREAEKWAYRRWPNERLFSYCLPTVARGGHRLIRWGQCFLEAGWLPVANDGDKMLWEKVP